MSAEVHTHDRTHARTHARTHKHKHKHIQNTYKQTHTYKHKHTHTAIHLMESKSPLGRGNSHSFPASLINPGLHALQLVAGMGPRAAKSGKFMPAGLVATLGLLSSVYQVRVSSLPSPSSPSRLWRRSYTTHTACVDSTCVFRQHSRCFRLGFPPHCLPLVLMVESDMNVYKWQWA